MKRASNVMAESAIADTPLGRFLREPQRIRVTLEIEVPLTATAEQVREFVESHFYPGRPVSVSNPMAHDEFTPVDSTLGWTRL